MLHVQNKYEECSKHYQDTLTKLPEPSPNATHKAIEEVCWYVICIFRFNAQNYRKIKKNDKVSNTNAKNIQISRDF